MEKPIDAVLFENDGDSSQGGQGCLHHRLRLTVDSTALTAAHVDGEPFPNDATSSDGVIYFTAAAASKWIQQLLPAPRGHHKGATSLKLLHLSKGASLPSLTRTVRPPLGNAGMRE